MGNISQLSLIPTDLSPPQAAEPGVDPDCEHSASMYRIRQRNDMDPCAGCLAAHNAANRQRYHNSNGAAREATRKRVSRYRARQ